MSDETGSTEAPTRREYVKYGGAVVGGGLLAGCAGDSAPETTPAETSETTTTERKTTTTSETDSSYEVTVEPYGPVAFDEVPKTYVTMGSGAWTDIGFAFGNEPIAMSMSYYPFQYYRSLPDVSFDENAVTDLGEVSAMSTEQLFEIDADVHIVDKQLVASYSGWDGDGFDQIENNVGPFAGSYIRGEWSGNALGMEFSFPYYTLPEAITLVGNVFKQRERASVWTRQLESFTADIADRLPESTPDVGIIYSGSDPSKGTFFIASPTAAGVGNFPYGVLDVTNGFADLTDAETYQTDYEGLLEMDPDYICVDSAISQLSPQEFESKFIDTMSDDPVGRELSAVKNDAVVRGCGRHQGPIIAHFETEAMAKQLHPDEFGAFDPERFPEVLKDERLFDRQRLADIINGEF
ncbi:ABC transporter substrate-binding protein [Haladaptatus sp. CMAA 1911]|uniref:ABC transporter substrate-binding protein n=1 Tax=unclassified Haladaptatus TaxID=2622732 RepID=UPI0037543EF8